MAEAHVSARPVFRANRAWWFWLCKTSRRFYSLAAANMAADFTWQLNPPRQSVSVWMGLATRIRLRAYSIAEAKPNKHAVDDASGPVNPVSFGR